MAERLTKAQSAFAALQSGAAKPNAIQNWQITGPFGLDFDKAFAPETEYLSGKLNLQRTYKGLNDAEVKWEHINEGKTPGADVIDFRKYFNPADNVSAYAFTKIVSDRERDATLLTGSDDGIIVWLNGQKVQTQNVWRGAQMDSERVPVHLKAGENTVLVKVTQGGGGWGFFLRIADEFGLPIKGIAPAL
jgi:hypothetical protein